MQANASTFGLQRNSRGKEQTCLTVILLNSSLHKDGCMYNILRWRLTYTCRKEKTWGVLIIFHVNIHMLSSLESLTTCESIKSTCINVVWAGPPLKGNPTAKGRMVLGVSACWAMTGQTEATYQCACWLMGGNPWLGCPFVFPTLHQRSLVPKSAGQHLRSSSLSRLTVL
jgi:hypothetical protein